MASPQIYILIVLVVLAIITFFVIIKKKRGKLTPIEGIAFAFVIAGVVFGDNRLLSYSLMGLGILLSVIDLVLKLKKK